ncbi:hypothetical protein F5I97DRAFT_345881 [Phlebopus sp. FC_14]|nr:hypothetical protein F5I97DRAFT_345881 [Phlebopus sp. FC_14]
MFQFNFAVDEATDELIAAPMTSASHEPPTVDHLPSNAAAPEPFRELSLDSLLDALPSQISYSPLSVPLSDGNELKLARRDLFDARFQLISEGTAEPEVQASDAETTSALQFLDNPSDLIPLVYEGGLKTWECSLDLVSYLSSIDYCDDLRGMRILELGCGTAVPTLYILHKIFSSEPNTEADIHVHLQDYNASVLQLVTLPNIILTWYHSPAADDYRNSENHEALESELNITPLLGAFKTSLQSFGICLRIFSGSWDTFKLETTGGNYNLLLTSETIYRPVSLPSLISLMRDACQVVSLSDSDRLQEGKHRYLCLVAAKIVYFGVGGGVPEFVRCIEQANNGENVKARVDVVWEKTLGVSRQVMSIRWT